MSDPVHDLDLLGGADDFIGRHIGPSDAELAEMLAVLGVGSLEELVEQALPAAIRSDEPLALGAPRTVTDVLAELRAIADRNRPRRSMIGMGYTGTITPPVILRNVLEDPAWYTAYTPYQPEISQGRLEALLMFQTMVSSLTGLEVANASLLDEATAAAEAMTMARRLSKVDGHRFFVHHDTHPQTRAVLATRAKPLGIELVVGDVDVLAENPVCFGALLSVPTSTGAVVDFSDVIATAKARGTIVVVATDLLACVLTRSPAQLGADIAVGSAQRFGVPMGFGGPHAAFMAAHAEAARAMPGRLVGVSTDTAGRPALRLALQTREQHIRREKATSNICTAQVLLANIAGLYAAWHGPQGLRRIAERTHVLAALAASELTAAGLRVRHATFFDTVTVDGVDAAAIVAAAAEVGIDLRRVSDSAVGLTCDETTTLDLLADALRAFGIERSVEDLRRAATTVGHAALPAELRRFDEILPHAVFHRYRTEHEMLRFLRRLADKDLALDRTMIPLGSCTMKLNATAEMIPITWPAFADLHPYAPDDESEGYRALIDELEQMLCVVTGYDAVSLQPNAGSQGEYAGLLAIAAYHRSRGDHVRDVCLIPSSAHGTNAASAVMAGYRVVVVGCDDRGNVDLADLDAKLIEHDGRVAAMMITYPSTHGVFEAAVTEICAKVHGAGGQVYVDGANLNALVGLSRVGRFGADVGHLNLHKTFCIPHGGGGPGVGPIGVRAHLAPYLPGDPLGGADQTVGPVSAARYGSAGILPISWVYISLMGAAGLTRATQVAIASANYIATRLDSSFPVLYAGANGRVAHECILDLRAITRDTGVTVDDVAKRLTDYGFHAPTVSFPVAGTLMVEPTESETKGELDRFCEAMIAIRAEIDRVAAGEWPVADSPLRHAPHTVEDVAGDWDRPYPRDLAAFPIASLRNGVKYFPPVARIDAAYGDRNLVCSCEPLEAYAAAHTGAAVAGE
jgi:glycine dehydrogenase